MTDEAGRVRIGDKGACDRCGGSHDCDGSAQLVDRRAFITRSAFLTAAAVLVACAPGGGGFSTAPGSVSFSFRLSDYPALNTVGGVALVSPGGAPFAVVRTGASTFETFSRICPHQGGTVNPSGSGFLCSRHGALFSLSGQWIGGQPTSNLRSYATAYNASTDLVTVG
jgi:nitrite reductase/ring-hydroxylating ferredoxin subunit